MFETNERQLRLISFLADTQLSKRLRSDFEPIRFGDLSIVLYGSEATVGVVGEPIELLLPYFPATGIRRILEWIGLRRPPAIARNVVSYGISGHSFSIRYQQSIKLLFPHGEEAIFNFRGVRSIGLKVQPNDHISTIFCSSCGDLIPFAVKCGPFWVWLYSEMEDRLEFGNFCHGDFARDKFQAIAGYINDTY